MGSRPALDYSLTFYAESPGAKDMLLVIGSSLHHVSGKKQQQHSHGQYPVLSQHWDVVTTSILSLHSAGAAAVGWSGVRVGSKLVWGRKHVSSQMCLQLK